MSEERMDAILQSMQELTETVKEHKEDRATLEWDDVKETFEAQIDAMVDTRVQDAIDKQAVRRVPGAPISEGGDLHSELPGKNKYVKEVKDFAKDGFYRVGTQKVLPVDFELAYILMEKGHAMMPERIGPPSEDLREALKAMTSTGTGTGDELVPTNMATSLWEDFFLASRVAGLIEQIPMPSNPFDWPLGLGDTTWRKGAENTATTATDLATAKITLTVTELLTELVWSYTLDEDAIIALMPAARRRLSQSGAELIDAFILNADSTNAATGNINLDDANPDDDSYYLSDGQDGIRHLWLVDNTSQTVNAGGDALADADVVDLLLAMGKYAADPMGVVMVTDVSTYLGGMLDLDEVVTVDKFGSDAVVKTGQLAAYRGVPIVLSASAPLTEADGKVSTTSGNNTLGQISAFKTNMWVVGFKRQLLIEVDRDIRRRQYIMVVSLREAVGCHGTRSSATHTAGIRNILV